MLMKFHSLRVKIILVCAVCITVAGLLSNALLYLYMTSIVTEKVEHIDRMTLHAVQSQINQTLYRFESLGDLCANDADVARAMRSKGLTNLGSRRDALNAHEALRRCLSASGIERNVVKLMAFNDSGLTVQTAGNDYSTASDAKRVRALDIFDEAPRDGALRQIAISPSIVNGQSRIAFLSPIYDYAASAYRGWIYMEMDMEWIEGVIDIYGDGSFLVADGGGLPVADGSRLAEAFRGRTLTGGETLRHEGAVYKLEAAPLRLAGLQVFSCADITRLSGIEGRTMLYTTLVALISSLVAALMLAVLLSSIITRPLNGLMTRIGRIAKNDFSYDQDIERGGDEIAMTGKMINEMTRSFCNLLRETEKWYEKQKDAEIALLHSQVNPHFLYNTLESIYWMSTIQKNSGIMTMTRSLSSLLRNIAKGAGGKVTLGEELAFLQDYVDIQSLRYMEKFTYINRVPEYLRSCVIVKLTLQPLVENAIFHGIEPKGAPGVIEVDAMENGDFLLITVRDDGAGMTPEELEFLTKRGSGRARSESLSGIGFANVHERLRLTYGSQCGLSCESEKGAYTVVTVRIPMERGEGADVSGASGGRRTADTGGS